MLGISFGIFTISGILAMVDSLETTLTKNMSNLGNTVMFVHNWPWKDNSSDWHRYFNRPKVSYHDYEVLQNGLGNRVEGLSFHISVRNQTLKYEGQALNGIQLQAVTQDYGNIYSLDVLDGRFFSSVESEAGRPVCVLGYGVAFTLLGAPPYEGQEVLYKGRKLKVVGVIKKQGNAMFGQSIDEQVFIPYTFGARLFNLNSRRLEKLITVKAKKYEDLEQIEGEVIGLMRKARGLHPQTEDTFSINKQEMLMNQMAEVFKYLNIGGIVIAFFSVLVGGFGIGNIMYASVKERVFEIGLMKAVGATPFFILLQFLFEAIAMCILGGVLGLSILFGLVMGAKYLIAAADFNFSVVLSTTNILIGMGLSASIGIIAGFLPALFAARLVPIDALRSKL